MPQSIMPDYQVLGQLGITKTAIKCYEALFNNGGVSVPQLAEQLRLPRTGLYRPLKQLEAKGFVASLKTESQPVYFYAEPLNKALQAYANYQQRLVQELIKQQNETLTKRH